MAAASTPRAPAPAPPPAHAAGKDDAALHDAIAQFLTYLETYRPCSPATTTAYRHDLKRFSGFLTSRCLSTQPTAIDTRVVQAFAVSLSGLAPATVNRALNCLSSFFGFLERQGLVSRNPVTGVERPRVPLKLPRGPSLSECQRFVEAARDERERALLLLLACCGLRRGELLALDVADLDADLSQLRVRQGKGAKDRAVPVPGQCRGVLRGYLDTVHSGSGPLFVTRKGTRLGVTGFNRIFQRVLRRAGLEAAGITPHGLRHTYATHLLRGRADIEVVRTLLGHRDIRTTSRYLHADDEGRREAVERLPLLLPPDPTPAGGSLGEVADHE